MSGNDYNPNSFDATLSRIEAKQDGHTVHMDRVEAKVDRLQSRVEKRCAEIEGRLTKIERWKYWVMGASATVGATLSQALEWFKK